TGVFTGEYAVNPINGEKIPIWVSDYVLMSYGTGVVMAVPAHDERDFEFAGKFDLPIRRVIKPEKNEDPDELVEAYTEEGYMLNSGKYDGMKSEKFKKKIVEVMEEEGFGNFATNYKLRDWLISRQRYWGAPIPIIYCDDCGEVPVPEEDLPVKLPMDVDFKPTGESPLKEHPDFKYTKCPKCGKDAVRECDTMDTFVDSSWYFLRYLNPQDDKKPFDKDLANRWLPVDKYVGGAEHAVMHLMYARFFTMALNDIGMIDFEEPFKSLRHQGIILGPDGKKMSKSKGNVINPDDYIDEYGADVLRVYLMFAYDYETGGAWDDDTLKATDRFLNRVWRLVTEEEWAKNIFEEDIQEYEITDKTEEWNDELERKLHKTIKDVTEDAEDFKFNTAISKIMELNNKIYKYIQRLPRKNHDKELLKTVIEKLIQLFAPFAPHMCEELWQRIGNEYSIFQSEWPEYEEDKLVAETVTIAAQINGKVRDEIEVPVDADEEKIKELALKSERVQKYTEGKDIVKTIVVPKRIINFVVK
ncbi:MAG: leucine--tRNA ligase, partial [Candidatus Mcinerneyibacterium aminivorans]